MMVWKNITVTVFLLLLGAYEVSAPENKSTCSAAPVKEGDSAKVTCHFGRDLSQTKEDFEIKHDNAAVMSCSWFTGKQDCRSQESEHDGPITYEFDYIIPKAKLENAGHYKCQMSQSTSLDVESCFLEVRGPVNNPVLTIENSSTTASFKNGTLDENQREIFSKRKLYFLFLLLLVPFSVSVFYCIKKRHSIKRICYSILFKATHGTSQWKKNQNDDEESQTGSERGTPDKISDFENKDTKDSSQIDIEMDFNITKREESNNVDTSFDMEGRCYPYQQLTESHKVLATDTPIDNSELSELKPFNFENEQTKYPHEVNVTVVSETGNASLKEVKAQSGNNAEVSVVCPSPAITGQSLKRKELHVMSERKEHMKEARTLLSAELQKEKEKCMITNTENIPLLEAKEEFAYNIADM